MKPRNRFKRPRAGDALEDLDPDTMQAVREAFEKMINPKSGYRYMHRWEVLPSRGRKITIANESLENQGAVA